MGKDKRLFMPKPHIKNTSGISARHDSSVSPDQRAVKASDDCVVENHGKTIEGSAVKMSAAKSLVGMMAYDQASASKTG